MRKITLFLALMLIPVLASASIITTPDSTKEGEWLCFRANVNIDKVRDIEQIRIAADSKYWLWVNGELQIFEGGLKRGPNPTDSYVDCLESIDGLRSGNNQITILVWYFGKESFSHRNSPVAGVSFEIIAKGKGKIVESDATWRVSKAPGYYTPTAELPNYRLPESNVGFDARLAEEWSAPDYDDSSWSYAKVVADDSASWGNLIERPIPMWRDYGLRDYEEITREGNIITAKLPYNCQITPYLKVKATAGKTVDIRTDNYMGGGAANVYSEYITRDGVQEYESYGWMNGHYVYYTIPDGVEVVSLQYRETGYDVDFAGSFECSDEFLNKLWAKSQRTLYVTMRDTYMDCPDRERAQWWGDVVNELGEAFYSFDNRAHLLTRKGIHELMDYQRADSTIYSPVPSSSWDKELPMQMLASVGYYGFWTYYMGSGDRETIEYVYPKVKRYLGVWKVGADGLVIQRRGGWMWGDWGGNKDMTLLFNLWYAIALDGFSQMAAMLGESADAAEATAASKRLKERFHEKFWNGSYYISPNYKRLPDDRAQALAIVAGVLPEELYPTIRPFFAENEHASPYMEKYVMQALCQMGYYEDVITRAKRRFGEMIASPYSTLWEGWSVGDKAFGGGSNNHAWSGGGLTVLSQYFAGVSTVEPGFKLFEVRPNMASLEWIRSVTPTDFGDIELYIEQDESEMSAQLVVPKSTVARFVAPEWATSIVVNGRSYAEKQIELKSGKYKIKIAK